ncbi:DsbA family protein [Oceaniglobus trochenteri]|uniref:DsbA family protein n=1 Tax=Oceaniglobus trochenteri TaxID=2763260 RepID=UPI001CFFC60F|nr:DsbA family protein [Oceaniglobus trochenteri]
MLRTPLTALALSAALALPAGAEMSDAERTEFRAEVRAYLLDNPEVLMEAIGVLEQRQAEQQAMGDQQLLADNADALFNDGASWVGGNPEGDVTIVEFLDYRCGYCKRAHPEVAELLARDGNIRLIVKEYPILGEDSVTGARFAIATKKVAGDDAYRTMNDALMALRGDMTADTLRALADENGLDGDAIIAAMSDPEVNRIIAANRALGQRLNINGTPSFVFGDQMVRGYVPLDTMEQIVKSLREG